MRKIWYAIYILCATLIVLVFAINKARAQDLRLYPIVEEIWVQNHTVHSGDNYCQTTNRDSGEYVLLAIPTVVINTTLDVIIHGYPGDSYININPLCPGTSYHIPFFQQFVIRDYCSKQIIRISPKSYFALQDNMRPFYYNRYTGQIQRYYIPSVVNALLADLPNLDTVALSQADYFTDTTNLDLQFTSAGAGDVYWCDEPGNQVDVTGLNDRYLLIDVILTPTPSSHQDSTVYTFPIYLDPDYHLFSGVSFPVPVCPELCNSSNPDPLNISVSQNYVFWDSTGACDFNDLEILVWHTKPNRTPEYRVIQTVPITTETLFFHSNALTYRDLQREGRSIPWTFNGGSYSYGYKIGNTITAP